MAYNPIFWSGTNKQRKTVPPVIPSDLVPTTSFLASRSLQLASFRTCRKGYRRLVALSYNVPSVKTLNELYVHIQQISPSPATNHTNKGSQNGRFPSFGLFAPEPRCRSPSYFHSPHFCPGVEKNTLSLHIRCYRGPELRQSQSLTSYPCLGEVESLSKPRRPSASEMNKRFCPSWH